MTRSQPLAFALIAALALASTGTPVAEARQHTLTLEEFLDQVRTSHDGAKASKLSSEGALERAEEGDLVTGPSFFAQASKSLDQKPNPFFPYKEQITDNYNFGVSQQTTFGLTGKLFYNFTRTEFDGIPPQLGLGQTTYYEGRPELDVTFSLWRNGFGSETRATRDAVDAAALAAHFGQRYQLKGIIADAETTFWRLALARETVTLQQAATDRSQKIYDWSSRRAKLHLADDADALQAEAALNARQLQLQQALDDERTFSRAFNLERGVSSDEVKEALPPMDSDVLAQMKVPAREELRDDTKAAQQNQRATEANSQLSIEKDRPSLDLFGNFAYNSKDGAAGTAFSGSLKDERPTTIVGVKFSAPLDLLAAAHAKEGWAKERIAADLTYQRKYLEQESQWTDLNRKLTEAKRRLDLALKIEDAQKRKLTHERERLNKGRTTTYQVLLFEQDFQQAQLGRIQAEADIINTIVQMKLFGSQT